MFYVFELRIKFAFGLQSNNKKLVMHICQSCINETARNREDFFHSNAFIQIYHQFKPERGTESSDRHSDEARMCKLVRKQARL